MTQPLDLPLLLEPEQLLPLLDDSNVLIVDLSNQNNHLEGHIPGALHLPPAKLICGERPAIGKLPELDQLAEAFELLGYTGQQHLVVYDDEGGGWAGRLIWTLDLLGIEHYSYLNGGLHAWRAEGYPLETGLGQAREFSHLDFELKNPDVRATLDYVHQHLDHDEIVVWDARSPAEYTGEKVLADKGGHIPGAINFEWTAGMDPARHLRLRLDLARTLEQLGITPDKEIITHCQTHHRSGFTYLAAKILGYPRVRAYDGSWSEWGNHPDTPVA